MILEATSYQLYSELGIDQSPSVKNDTRVLYLDMVKRAVCNLIYEDISLWSYDRNYQIVPMNRFDLKLRLLGEDMPTQAHTMIGWHRLSNIEKCACTALEESIPGDFVEAGVLRGGASIFMRAVLKAYGNTDRKVLACDTFVNSTAEAKKLPTWVQRSVVYFFSLATRIPSQRWKLALYRILEANQQSFPKSENPSPEWVDLWLQIVRYMQKNQTLQVSQDRVSLAAVKSHFARYGLLDSQVLFLKGFFSETLPSAPIQSVALLRCDGDSYESTITVLDALYPKVSKGGFVVIDDYNSFSDCKKAVDEYRAKHKIFDELIYIDNAAAYWRKSA